MLLSFAFAVGLFSGPTPIVARIDHIIIQAPDPKPLFTLLTDVFELPVAWPLQSYGVFASGGVFVGNVNIEIMQGPAAAAEWAHESPGPRLHGIAFEPHESAAESVTLLKKRSVGHSLPAPFFGVRMMTWSMRATIGVGPENRPTANAKDNNIFHPPIARL